MISPLTSSTIKGVIWYQGENDVSGVGWYAPLFPNLIQSWRDAWGLGDFTFYHVQLPPCDYGGSNSALLREVQLKTLSMKNVGIAVTLDLGDFKNIHPDNKKDVGERLALWAFALVATDAQAGTFVSEKISEGDSRELVGRATPDGNDWVDGLGERDNQDELTYDIGTLEGDIGPERIRSGWVAPDIVAEFIPWEL